MGRSVRGNECRPVRDLVPFSSSLPRAYAPSASLRAGSGLTYAAPSGLGFGDPDRPLRPELDLTHTQAGRPQRLKPDFFLGGLRHG